MTPQKLKLKAKICLLRSRLRRIKMKRDVRYFNEPSLRHINRKLNHVLIQLKELLPEKLFLFVETQIKMSQVQPKGQRWSTELKLFALSIFYQSRKAYNLLQKIFFLPSPRTLQRAMSNTNISPGFNEDIFNAIKLKFKSIDKLDKHCVLMFDEMALKSNLLYNKAKDCIDGFEDYGELGRTHVEADHALVFMARGITRNWKQPLGYFLVSGSVKPTVLQSLVHICLSRLSEAGLFVTTIVCDQGPTNRCFLEKLEKVSVEQPYLIHDYRNIFVLYDPPHLLKNIRNNLKKKGFIWNDHSISWKYIEDFYTFDKSLSIRMAPRLTDKHLQLPPFTNMRVNLAAQVLSHSVAAGINTLSVLLKLESNAVYTAEFIENFDQLFNACNSSSIHSSQKMGHAITKNTTHEQFLRFMLEYIEKLKQPNSNKCLPCINGWKISITAILKLWKYMQENNYTFLMTRRLNQDCLENFFSVIRGLGGNRDNPDVQQFKTSFRHALIDKLFSPNLGSNCELDYDQILLDLQNILAPNLSDSLKSNFHQEPNLDDNANYCFNMKVKMNDLITPVELSDNDNVLLEMNVTCEDNYHPLTDYDCLDLIVDNDLSLEVTNVAAYMGGYLLRKGGFCKADTCQKCLDLFTTSPDKQSVKHTFISFKTFREFDCLIYPSSEFCNFVENLEKLFLLNIDNLIYASSGLIEKLYNLGVNQLNLSTCGNAKCINITKYMVKLYLTARIHFKIKICNQERSLKEALKRNRKAKKIVHE